MVDSEHNPLTDKHPQQQYLPVSLLMNNSKVYLGYWMNEQHNFSTSATQQKFNSNTIAWYKIFLSLFDPLITNIYQYPITITLPAFILLIFTA